MVNIELRGKIVRGFFTGECFINGEGPRYLGSPPIDEIAEDHTNGEEFTLLFMKDESAVLHEEKYWDSLIKKQ